MFLPLSFSKICVLLRTIWNNSCRIPEGIQMLKSAATNKWITCIGNPFEKPPFWEAKSFGGATWRCKSQKLNYWLLIKGNPLERPYNSLAKSGGFTREVPLYIQILRWHKGGLNFTSTINVSVRSLNFCISIWSNPASLLIFWKNSCKIKYIYIYIYIYTAMDTAVLWPDNLTKNFGWCLIV